MPGLGPLIPIVFFLVIGAMYLTRSDIGRAIADRIRGGTAGDARWQDEVAELRRDVEGLRAELAETHERLDFAERLLATGRDSDPRLKS
jgi:hypothetical protein